MATPATSRRSSRAPDDLSAAINAPTAGPRLWLSSGIRLADLPEALEMPPAWDYTVTGLRRRKTGDNAPPPAGRRVHLNGEHIALYKTGGKPHAFSAVCPHAGGDLALGDIEEYERALCVSCPVHGFRYALSDGVSTAPAGSYRLKVYPAEARGEDEVVHVGFSALHGSAFTSDDF